MARDHTRIHTDIWGDDDWLDLSPQAQHLYFVLTTWPPSLCGSGDWQPRKVAARARGWTVPDVLDAAEELVAGDFTLIDIDTEEYLLRSWIKHDGLYRVQNMAVSVANARAALASRTLRGVVVHEVLKLRKSEPNLDSWNRDPVQKMLDQKAVDPDEVDWSSPWDSPSVSGWSRGNASPKVAPETSPSDSSRATALLPTPTPSSHSTKDGPRTRGCRLPDGWTPSAELIAEMRTECPGVDLKAEHRVFTDFWKGKSGKDATKADWDATWRNWMRREQKSQRTRGEQSRSGSAVDEKFNGWMDMANSTPGRELE